MCSEFFLIQHYLFKNSLKRTLKKLPPGIRQRGNFLKEIKLLVIENAT